MDYVPCQFCRNYYDKARSSLRLICDDCTRKALIEKNADIKVLRSRLDETYDEIEKLRSRLTFLGLEFDTEFDGVRKADVFIVVQGREEEPLPAHKYILSSRSSVLCRMFDIQMTEEDTGIVRIDDTTLPVMRAVIKFCYDSEITFTDEVLPEKVLQMAHKYDIPLLQTICESQLIPTITNTNLANMLRVAKTFELTGLHEAALQHFKTNFDKVIGDVMEHYPRLSLELNQAIAAETDVEETRGTSSGECPELTID